MKRALFELFVWPMAPSPGFLIGDGTNESVNSRSAPADSPQIHLMPNNYDVFSGGGGGEERKKNPKKELREIMKTSGKVRRGATCGLFNQLTLHVSRCLPSIFRSLLNDFIQPVCIHSFLTFSLPWQQRCRPAVSRVRRLFGAAVLPGFFFFFFVHAMTRILDAIRFLCICK